MLFGDSGRSGMAVSSRHPEVAAVKHADSTHSHVGPGAYHTEANENIRSGWVKRSYSTRQPMAPGSSPRKARYANYTDGVLVGSGLAQGTRDSNSTPGPGHYNTTAEVKPVRYGTYGPFDATNNSRRYPNQPMSSGSPRILLPSSSVKNGVVFQGKHEEHSTIGPGHYGNVDEGQMLKKSFNVRASDGNSPGKRPGSAGQRSPRGASPSYASYYNNSPQAQSAQGGYPNTPNRDYYNHVEADSGVKTPYQ